MTPPLVDKNIDSSFEGSQAIGTQPTEVWRTGL